MVRVAVDIPAPPNPPNPPKPDPALDRPPSRDVVDPDTLEFFFDCT